MSLSIDLIDVQVSFPRTDGSHLHALGPVQEHIASGSFVALLGPSGCGKSTLVRVIAGLQQATSGEVWVGGEMIQKPSPGIALMFQSANLMPWRTVEENIALPLELAGQKGPQRERVVSDLLPLLGLQSFAGAYPAQLSGGMAQRVALGRVLVQRPQVLLLDEPFGALDAMTRERISLDLLALWQQTGQTALMVTHDINEAVLLADRVLVMSQRPGRIIADIAVPLPRPRDIEMMYHENFVQTARLVRDAIDRS